MVRAGAGKPGRLFPLALLRAWTVSAQTANYTVRLYSPWEDDVARNSSSQAIIEMAGSGVPATDPNHVYGPESRYDAGGYPTNMDSVFARNTWAEVRILPPVPRSARAGRRRLCPGLLASLWLGSVLPSGSATAPAWSLNQPIYEVNLQMFSQAGGYKELEKHLPELKSQGVGILWLMPINTRGVLKAFNSPYCVKDYRGFHAPFGGPQDFRALVAATHAQGLHLILDWVPNHTSWDNALIREHPEFYKRDAGGKISQAYGWSDVAQLDYGNQGLRAWMIEAMKSWISDYDVDGFRCDVAWGVPQDFWVQARAELDKLKPVFMLADPTMYWTRAGSTAITIGIC